MYGLTAMIGWGISNFAAAQLSRRIGAVPAMFWNTLGVCILMILLLPVFGQPFLLTSTHDIYTLAVAGLLLGTGGITFYKSTLLGKVSLVSPLAASWPIVIATISVFTGASPPGLIKVFALACIFIGALIVSIKFTASHRIFTISDPGVPYALVTLLLWSLAFYLFGTTLKTSPWVTANVYFNFWAALTTLLYGIVTKINFSFLPSRDNTKYLGLFCLAATSASVAYSLGVQSSQTALTAAIANASPIVTVFLAFFFLKEKLNNYQFIGVVTIVLGLIFL